MSQLLPARVLIVDDDPLYVGRARAALQGCVELQIVASHDAALAAIVDWAPDVVIVDSLLNNQPAFKLLDEMRERTISGVPRVVYLARGAGSIQRMQSDSTTFLGVVRRESGIDGLMNAVRCALAAASAGRGFIT